MRKKLAAGIIGIAVMTLIYWAFYAPQKEMSLSRAGDDEDTTVSLITGFKHIRASEGKIHWELTAREAEERTSGNILLREVDLKFYDAGGEQPVIAHAREAIYEKEKMSISLGGEVSVRYGDLMLLTDKLEYQDADGFLFSKSAVEIRNRGSVIYAHGLKAHTREKRLQLFEVTGNLKPEDMKGMN